MEIHEGKGGFKTPPHVWVGAIGWPAQLSAIRGKDVLQFKKEDGDETWY